METRHLSDYNGDKAAVVVSSICNSIKINVPHDCLPLEIDVYGLSKKENAELLKRAIMEEAEHLCALVDKELEA